MQQIPLDNSPNQNFNVTLELNGKNVIFNLYLSYNADNYWTIQVRDKNKKTITDSIPLLCGQNLLQGLEYLEIGEAYLIKKSKDTNEIPNTANIGIDYYLLWRNNQ